MRASIACPYCAYSFALTVEAVAELERYQGAVRAALGHADEQYRQAAQWRWTETSQRSALPLWAIMGMVYGPAIVGAFVAQAALMSGVGARFMPFFSIGIVAVVMLSVIGLSSWLHYRARPETRRAQAGKTRVACPSCGGPNELGGGQALETCRYCRAALMPGHVAMQQGIGSAQHAARRAAIERVRAERAASAAIAARTQSTRGFVAVFAMLPILGAVLAVCGGLLFSPRIHPLAAAFLLVMFLGVIVCGFTTVLVWRSWWKKRFSSAIDDLTRQFAGRRLSGLEGVVSWLNAYWPAAYDFSHVSVGPYHQAATIDAGGYAALLDIDPASRAHPYRARRVQLLLAASLPDVVAANPNGSFGPAADMSRFWLEQAGFAVSPAPHGITVSARAQALDRLCDSPDALHVLSTVITTAVGFARALGAQTVEPQP